MKHQFFFFIDELITNYDFVKKFQKVNVNHKHSSNGMVR